MNVFDDAFVRDYFCTNARNKMQNSTCKIGFVLI